MSAKAVHHCAVCGVPSVSSCSACRSIFYCGSTCQKEHWSVHKDECTRKCMLEYSGTLTDGKIGTPFERTTNFTFKEPIQSKKIARDWKDAVKGSQLMEVVIEKYNDAKFALQDCWSCRICGGSATRIFSRVDCHIVFHSKDRQGQIILNSLRDQVICNKESCTHQQTCMADYFATGLVDRLAHEFPSRVHA